MIKSRIEKLQNILNEEQCAIISNSDNRFYFTNFKSSAGTVLITKTASYLLIDFRYYEKAKNSVKDSSVILCEKLYSQMTEILKNHSIKEILVESDCISLASFQNFKEKLKDFEISSKNTLTEQIKKQRSIKTEEEIRYIEKAQELTDQTFSYILSKIKTGITEKEIMLDMEFFARSNGSEGVAFDYIVVSGKNSSLPHGVPTHRKIEKGDFITMDFGCVIDGYRSDMTRTVAVGNVTPKQQMIYETVLKAQLSALENIKPDVPCNEIDSVAREIISNAGFGNCFGHGLGHSVGLEIHESPAFNTRDTIPLKQGMIMTVEPGIYIQNEFGVRIEDMIVVTEDGYRNFTKSPKELLIL